MSANQLSPQLPVQIDPFKWADLGFTWKGIVPVRQFVRIANLVEGSLDAYVVHVDCRLSKDDYLKQVAWLDASLSTHIPMLCQRCLEAVMVQVDTSVHIALIDDLAKAEQLDDDADFVVLGEEQLAHQIADEHSIDLVELLEDELLVSLPITPRHDNCHNQFQALVEDAVEHQRQDNPFDVLASLKGQLKS